MTIVLAELVKKAQEGLPFHEPGAATSLLPCDIGLKQFEDIIGHKLVTNPDYVQIAKNGETKFPSINNRGRLSAKQIRMYYRDGHTVIANFLANDNKEIWKAKNHLEKVIGSYVECSAFLTPIGSSGFSAHFDSADIFLVQVNGRKRWQVFEEALRYPLEEQKSTVELSNLGEPLIDLTLNMGDVLYIPRGYVHRGFVDKITNEPSLHLTFGILTRKNSDVLNFMIEELAIRNEWLREDAGKWTLQELANLLKETLSDETLWSYYQNKVDERLWKDSARRLDDKAEDKFSISEPFDFKQTKICNVNHQKVKLSEVSPNKLFIGGNGDILTIDLPLIAVKIVRKIMTSSMPLSLISLTGTYEESDVRVVIDMLYEYGAIELSIDRTS